MDIKVNLEKLKDRIKEQRKLKNFTQEQLGEKVQSTKQAVSHWELGDRTPDISTILLLAKTFGCSVSYLVGETDNPSLKIFKTDYKGHELEIEVSKNNNLKQNDVEKMFEEFKIKLINELKL